MRSRGRYLMALVRISDLSVRMACECTGSIDLSGRMWDAFQMIAANRIAEATALLEQLAAEDPHLGEVNYQLALIKRAPGTPEAIEAARRQLQAELMADPRSYRAHCSLGVTAKRQQELERALEHYEKSYALQPYYLDNLISMATTLISLGPQNLGRVMDLSALAYDLNPESDKVTGFLQMLRQQLGLPMLAHCRLAPVDPALH
ncbi:MAG: hypothetical protein HY814_08130 [Candidatus Riflebacteria bacterium]|nr:hypothetical protein [Candidatus Riflebacteria bacterium]